MKCRVCSEREANPESALGMCADCFAARRAEAAAAKRKCRHCSVRKAVDGYHRGLCFRCFGDKAIRHQYPTAHGKQQHGEPTEAELDAMIAEQMKNLPPWWHESQQRYREEGVDD